MFSSLTSYFLDPFIQIPSFGFIAVVLLGLLVGSFLNVVIHRVPKMLETQWASDVADYNRQASVDSTASLVGQAVTTDPIAEQSDRYQRYNLMTPPSACPNCKHKIKSWENIPVVSWLFLRGKCSACSIKISPRYPFIELLTGLLAGAAAWHFGPSVQLFAALILTFALVSLTWIDLDTQLLPDNMTLPLLWIGLLFNLHSTFVPLSHAVVGAVAGYLILWSIYWAFKLVTGKEGMGYGDFKLLAALGAWFGWSALPMIILLSSVVGLVAALGLMAFKGHQRSEPIPFGPYLAGAGMLVLYFRAPLGRVIGF